MEERESNQKYDRSRHAATNRRVQSRGGSPYMGVGLAFNSAGDISLLDAKLLTKVKSACSAEAYTECL